MLVWQNPTPWTDADEAAIQPKLQNVLDKYDIDTTLSDVKERIDHYSNSPSYYATITGHLRQILGYDFMKKDYKNEITQATMWLLNETMPHQSQHVLKKDQFEYNMDSLGISTTICGSLLYLQTTYIGRITMWCWQMKFRTSTRIKRLL